MKEQLTIIIPTHNRPALISRALEYYTTWGCKIIVCDSSQNEPEPFYLPNVHLLYCPELSFDQKLYKAVRQVTTPYVCLSADDDFLAVSSLNAGIEFLDNHDDYVSVQGHYLQFAWNNSELSIHPNYVSVIGFHIDDSEPSQRIIHTMNPFMHHIYSMHRSSVLIKSLAISLDYNAPPLAEFTTAIGGMIFGKHRMLPVFWMARDSGRYTVYNHNINDQETLVFNISKFLTTSDGLLYRARFAEAYATHSGEAVNMGKAVFDQAFSSYLSRQSVVREGFTSNIRKSLRQRIRKHTPAVVLQWRNWLLQKGFVPRSYPQNLGYPWSDSKAKEEWVIMKEIIMKHGQFPTVEDNRLL